MTPPTAPYRIRQTEHGPAVILDPKRAYATPLKGELVITDRVTRETLDVIRPVNPAPDGFWSQIARVIALRVCSCGKCL